ncbi:hypothetical protein [Pandoraea sp. SD6-2]|uniref:hypothetical protein n=1 Tax=Pandoraea sp. SD6-2 TaxID=1286093 RepID=UPI00032DF5DD|nr:hypothetical protein [Pandoraea sp. SD6-2]EON13513.1 hypothetical protein C266_11670 [Pandoraea sp. SD6-2]
MTLHMLIPTLFDRARARLTPASSASNALVTKANGLASPQYRLVVLTLASKADTVDAKVRHALRAQKITPETTSRLERSGGYLLELDYVLRCERSRRAALVHLVSTLGDTPGVRAIRWETAPNMATR